MGGASECHGNNFSAPKDSIGPPFTYPATVGLTPHAKENDGAAAPAHNRNRSAEIEVWQNEPYDAWEGEEIKYMKTENENYPTETTERFREMRDQLGEKARNASQVTDRFVHENAWATVAVAAVIGCLIGYFLRPRD